MGFRVFGSAEVLSVHTGPEQAAASVQKAAHRAVFAYTPREGFLYVRSRAISSRCNDNFDYFGPQEIEAAYKTFIGKPVFVNHHNSDHKQARGVIIDAALHKDRNPDGSPDTWAEVLMEIDGVTYPKLAMALLKGDIDRTSMGCDVQISKCSVCGNEAKNPLEYCRHIPGMKGKTIYALSSDGMRREGKLVYEECYGLSFFENSLLVEPPADPTAFFLGRVDVGPGLEHLAKAARLQEAAIETPKQPVTASIQRVASRVTVPESLITTNEIPSLDVARQALAALFKEAYKPEKPVKDMTEEEYAVHQQKVAQAKKEGEAWNRKHPVKIKNIVEHWNLATEDEKANGMRWYSDAHQLAQHVARDTDTPMHTMAGLLSNYSPQTHWATNIMNAARVARTRVALGGKGSGIMASSNQRKAAARMLRGEHYEDVLAGPKTRAFAHLIEHGGNADPDDPRVVIDRHALSVAAGARATDNAYSYSGLGGKGRYNQVAQAYHKAAKQISKQVGYKVEAHQVQAATWLARQRLNEAHDASLTKTATSRSAQNARRAVREWTQYASEHHPGAIGLEPGVGYANAPEDVKHSAEMRDEGVGTSKVAYNETKAPTDVDTLRDERCAICGNNTAFDGRECRVCGYIAPPKGLDDPDVEKAQQLDDLKQSVDQEMDESGADPSRPGADFDAGDMNQLDAGGDNSANPWLACTNCETEMRPAAPQTSGPSTNPGASTGGPAEGDPCPVCGKGQLASTGTSEDETDELAADEEEDEQDPGESKGDEDQPDDTDEDADDSNDEKTTKNKPSKNPAAKATAAMKYRDHTRESRMNNALRALAAQQEAAEQLQTLVDHQQRTIASLHQRMAAKDSQIQRLSAGLTAVARFLGVEAETQVRTAMLKKHADEQNPAQPVPEPVGGPPTQTTVDAETPEAFADVRTPGMVAGSNNDVPADAVTTAYTPGQDIAAPPFRQLVDVTEPVAGTQGPRPLSEVKTQVDVRAGNPMNPETAFPLGGPFAQAQRTGAKQDAGQDGLRLTASIRLARLRLQAGIEQGEDLAIGQKIASDPTMSMERINTEIQTLNQVRTAAATAQRAAAVPPRGAVPRSASAGVQRIVPPLSTTASAGNSRGSDDLTDVEAIFV